jgi:MFS family permease
MTGRGVDEVQEISVIQRGGMRRVIYAQCFGSLAAIMFSNGVMLTYLAALGFGSAMILSVLALPQLMAMVARVPAAYLADRFGKKRLGVIGHGGTIGGYILIASAVVFPESHRVVVVLIGILLYGLGNAGIGAGWFALLYPIVPAEMRGRFFGKLRVSWQAATLCLTFLISVVIGRWSGLGVIGGMMLGVAVLQLGRLLVYLRIPEIEKASQSQQSFLEALKSVIAAPDLLPFSCYVFLTSLVLGASASLIALMGKDILGFSEQTIVLMGALLLGGSMCGHYLGGKLVDHFGTRVVFLLGHYVSGVVLALILLRHWVPLPALVYMGAITVCIGGLASVRGIAATSEQFALMPKDNKSMASSFMTTMQLGAMSLSSIIASRIIDAGVLAESWSLWGKEMCIYDTLLGGAALAVMLVSVTLGLVPSVVGKSAWIPQG